MEKEKFLFFSEQYHQWFIWNVIPFSSVSTEKVSMLQSVIFSKCSCNQHYFALLKLNGTHTNFPIDAKWKRQKKKKTEEERKTKHSFLCLWFRIMNAYIYITDMTHLIVGVPSTIVLSLMPITQKLCINQNL